MSEVQRACSWFAYFSLFPIKDLFSIVVNMDRKVLRPFAFSNGVHIPVGAILSAVALPMYYDGEYYPDPEVFDPFRFSNLRANEGAGTRHAMVSTSSDYIIFGHGTQAWRVFVCYTALGWQLTVYFIKSWSLFCCN
jgi:Cytochrome P450